MDEDELGGNARTERDRSGDAGPSSPLTPSYLLVPICHPALARRPRLSSVSLRNLCLQLPDRARLSLVDNTTDLGSRGRPTQLGRLVLGDRPRPRHRTQKGLGPHRLSRASPRRRGHPDRMERQGRVVRPRSAFSLSTCRARRVDGQADLAPVLSSAARYLRLSTQKESSSERCHRNRLSALSTPRPCQTSPTSRLQTTSDASRQLARRCLR